MILIPRSEVDEIRQARNTADAECKKLQEELVRFDFSLHSLLYVSIIIIFRKTE